MKIKSYVENARVPITVIQIEGNIDSTSYQDFKSKAAELIQAGARYILVDLSQVPFVSSAGLRTFHELFNQLRKISPETKLSEDAVKKQIVSGSYKSPHIKLLNVSVETRSALQLSGFDMFIESFTEISAAIASF